MLRIWVLTVFTETDSSLAISGRDRFVGRYRSTRSSLGLSCSISAAAGGLAREGDVRRVGAGLQEGLVGGEGVVDRGRVRVLGGEPVVHRDDPGAGTPADLRGQAGGWKASPMTYTPPSRPRRGSPSMPVLLVGTSSTWEKSTGTTPARGNPPCQFWRGSRCCAGAAARTGLRHVVGTRSARRAGVARHHPMSTAPRGSPTSARRRSTPRQASIQASVSAGATGPPLRDREQYRLFGRNHEVEAHRGVAGGRDHACHPWNDGRISVRAREDLRQRERQGHHHDLPGW